MVPSNHNRHADKVRIIPPHAHQRRKTRNCHANLVYYPGMGTESFRVRVHDKLGQRTYIVTRTDSQGDPQVEVAVTFEGEEVETVTARAQSGAPLTPTVLQRLPWARALAATDALRRMTPDGGGGSTFSNQGTAGASAAKRDLLRAVKAPGEPTKGRPWSSTHDAAFYERIAARYLQLRGDGSTNPTAVIAAEEQSNRNTVAGWVRKARQLNYLPPARPGRAG
jgi:hypothetical protein